jgi:tRNA pseudouridine synthase 10
VTAGREDANVRMLGNGRPFYIELINPRTPSLKPEALKQLEAKINDSMPDKVQIRDLVAITLEDTKVIKEGEETKTKSYSALCWTSIPVNQAMIDAVNEFRDKSFYVEQQTPIRVLQRYVTPAVLQQLLVNCGQRHSPFFLSVDELWKTRTNDSQEANPFTESV